MTEPREIKERTFEFAIQIVALCRDLTDGPSVARLLVPSLLGAGTRVGAQVEDAHGNHGKADFIRKMSEANEAARETKYWLRLLVATDGVAPARLRDLADECSQLVAILTTIVKRSRENS